MINFQASLAEAAQTSVQFRFLNDFPPITIGNGNDEAAKAMLHQALTQGPSGRTPLCRHVNEIAKEVKENAETLRSNGQLAVLVIATDGESSDGDVAAALAQLKDLPIWVIIRLCTEEDNICEYWDRVDEQLEIRLDIISDYMQEGKQITTANPWLTYGEPLHRMREFGMIMKEMDMLDESLLGTDEMYAMCKAILGRGPQGTDAPLPDPSNGFDMFYSALKQANAREPETWDPVTRGGREWIHASTVSRKYNPSAACCTMM